MNEDWSAEIQAEEQDDGTFVPVLVLSRGPAPGNAVRVRIGGIHTDAEEAIAAGRRAVSDMLGQ